MKLAVFASLVSAAAAFAPAMQAATSTAVEAAKPFENELGVQQPLGYWDPLGLVANGDQAKFDRLRSVEIKHGRICQLGVVGYLTTYYGYRLPGDINKEGLKFADIPAGWEGSFKVPVLGAIQVLLFCGLLEIYWKQNENSFPGDLSGTSAFPVGWIQDFPEEQKQDLRAKELNQGRAAQMGMLALMVHDAMGNVDQLLP